MQRSSNSSKRTAENNSATSRNVTPQRPVATPRNAPHLEQKHSGVVCKQLFFFALFKPFYPYKKELLQFHVAFSQKDGAALKTLTLLGPGTMAIW